MIGKAISHCKILETDKSEDLHEDLENIEFLWGLIGPKDVVSQEKDETGRNA